MTPDRSEEDHLSGIGALRREDFTVPAKLNVPAMHAALAGNKAGEVEELQDSKLLFQTADVGIGQEANWAKEAKAPAVLKKIADWVIRQS